MVAVSFGAYIYGTTVVFPAVANPSLRKSNKTYWSNITASSLHSNQSELSNDSMVVQTYQLNSTEAYLPFLITDDDLSLVGKIVI